MTIVEITVSYLISYLLYGSVYFSPYKICRDAASDWTVTTSACINR